MSASAATLERRLRSVLALDGEFSKESARDCILRERISGAMCARAPEVGGKPLCFQQYFEVVFGEDLVTGKPIKAKEKKCTTA
jgi:hypothetical protein